MTKFLKWRTQVVKVMMVGGSLVIKGQYEGFLLELIVTLTVVDT